MEITSCIFQTVGNYCVSVPKLFHNSLILCLLNFKEFREIKPTHFLFIVIYNRCCMFFKNILSFLKVTQVKRNMWV